MRACGGDVTLGCPAVVVLVSQLVRLDSLVGHSAAANIALGPRKYLQPRRVSRWPTCMNFSVMAVHRVRFSRASQSFLPAGPSTIAVRSEPGTWRAKSSEGTEERRQAQSQRDGRVIPHSASRLRRSLRLAPLIQLPPPV